MCIMQKVRFYVRYPRPQFSWMHACCSKTMEPAAADSVRAGSMEKRSLLGLELEISEGDDDEDEEDVEKEADCRPGDHRRRRQSHPAAYDDDDDDELRKKWRLWQTYTGRRNLIATLPVIVGGLLLLVFVLREGTEASLFLSSVHGAVSFVLVLRQIVPPVLYSDRHSHLCIKKIYTARI
jgi:hypothetical protein